MTKHVIIIKVRKYEVNCKPNDSADRIVGEPATLGFDFYVDAEEPTKEIIEFIKKELERNDLPLISIVTKGYKFVSKPWTKKNIARCIKNNKTLR